MITSIQQKYTMITTISAYGLFHYKELKKKTVCVCETDTK